MGYAYIGIIMVCRVVQNLCSKNISMVLPVSLRGRLDYLTFSNGVSAAFALALLIFAGSFDSLDSFGGYAKRHGCAVFHVFDSRTDNTLYCRSIVF